MSSIEELVAFNLEVTALSRAGVPIDLGLSQLSPDPDNATDQINATIARRVQGGSSLVEAMSEEDQSLPPVYQSVVCAGLRCGRLPAAMESLNRHTQPMLDVRQTLRSSLVYPLIICLFAYVLFVGACLYLWPEYDQVFANTDSKGGALYTIVGKLRDWLPYWVAIPPVLLTALLTGCLRSKSPRAMQFRNSLNFYNWLPGVSDVTADQSRASLAEMVALLVEHDVTLHEALHLAARASGDEALASAMRQVADEMEHGQPIFKDPDAAARLPPFLRWALASSTESDDLARTLRLAAQTYRHRAQRRAEWIRIVAPTLTCAVLAGGVTLLYCLSIFGPFVEMIRSLS